MDVGKVEEGWRQVQAGVALLVWSRLARWNAETLSFAPVPQQDFESGHREIHTRYGRLICWLIFSVGTEYLCKGACLLKGHDVFGSKSKRLIRPPQAGENLQEWVSLVNQGEHGAPTVQEEARPTKPLGAIVDLVGSLVDKGSHRGLVTASIKLLAGTIRNRDAHRYAESVRSLHFNAVEDIFVPSLNVLLSTLDQRELRSRLSEAEGH